MSVTICETCKCKLKTFLVLFGLQNKLEKKDNGVLPLHVKDIRDLSYHLKFLIVQGDVTIAHNVAISEGVCTV